MYRSSEVRWFFTGELPSAVREWFVVGDDVRSEPTRTDEYLMLPDCRTASLKIREGRLEFKARTKAPQPVRYAGDIEGLRDHWIKWSSNRVDDEALRDLALGADDGRLLVTKHRLLRTFSLDAGDPREVDGSRIRLTDGCQVEVANITARSDHPAGSAGENNGGLQTEQWWSLSLEAFGEPGNIVHNLDHVATALFVNQPPAKLHRAASCSYPVWLARLAADNM